MFKVCTTLYGKKKLVSEEEIITRKSAYAVVVKGNRVLLVRTKSTGKYWFAGGVLDKNESKQEAVIRETKEETGLNIKIQRPLIEVESYFYFDHTEEAYRQLSHFFLCRAVGKNMPSDNNRDKLDEATKPEWVNIHDLKEHDFQDYGWEVFKLVNLK